MVEPKEVVAVGDFYEKDGHLYESGWFSDTDLGEIRSDGYGGGHISGGCFGEIITISSSDRDGRSTVETSRGREGSLSPSDYWHGQGDRYGSLDYPRSNQPSDSAPADTGSGGSSRPNSSGSSSPYYGYESGGGDWHSTGSSDPNILDGCLMLPFLIIPLGAVYGVGCLLNIMTDGAFFRECVKMLVWVLGTGAFGFALFFFYKNMQLFVATAPEAEPKQDNGTADLAKKTTNIANTVSVSPATQTESINKNAAYYSLLFVIGFPFTIVTFPLVPCLFIGYVIVKICIAIWEWFIDEKSISEKQKSTPCAATSSLPKKKPVAKTSASVRPMPSKKTVPNTMWSSQSRENCLEEAVARVKARTEKENANKALSKSHKPSGNVASRCDKKSVAKTSASVPPASSKKVVTPKVETKAAPKKRDRLSELLGLAEDERAIVNVAIGVVAAFIFSFLVGVGPGIVIGLISFVALC